MKIKMELLSDAIFGNGMSVPGEEDISVQSDEDGFPYYKGGTFKGVFREMLERYLEWTGNAEIKSTLAQLLGEEGSDEKVDYDKLVFSDFTLSDAVKTAVLKEIEEDTEDLKNGISSENPVRVLDIFTNMRTFTKVNEDGTAQKGSLRNCRCVNQGLVLYSEVRCKESEEKLVEEVIGMIKGIGTLRSRGFGNVKISRC